MRIGRLLGSAILLLTIPGIASIHSRRGPTSQRFSSRRTSKVSKPASQRAIGDDRATEIQTALTHAGYMSGEASGHWDTETEAAMEKYQADNGWQTKLIPDSRAIIKLGLGPNNGASSEPSALLPNTSDTVASSTTGSLR